MGRDGEESLWSDWARLILEWIWQEPKARVVLQAQACAKNTWWFGFVRGAGVAGARLAWVSRRAMMVVVVVVVVGVVPTGCWLFWRCSRRAT